MKLTWEYLVAVAGLIVTLLVAWFLGIWLRMTGTNLWILRIGIVALGVIAVLAFLLWAYSEKKDKAPAMPKAAKAESSAPAEAEGSVGGDEIERVIREAEAKVASSRLGQGSKLNALPAIFVLGASGSGKTTALLNCGPDPELLAGQVFHEGNVVPTGAANVWFARKTVFVEAGGKLASDSKAWTRLVQRLSPGKLQSVFGKKQQAPRAAVVVFDCEKFFKRGGAAEIPNIAKTLRARLEEMSQQMGSSFPVYCFFTKLDTVPYFDEFVATLSNEEGAQVLGITLPVGTAAGSGVYAEQESKRLSAAFNSLYSSLSDCRPPILSREHDSGKRAGIYEFPREFRKVGKPVVDFLVELCRPSHLRSGPFLRGFYFVGKRMVASAAPSPAILAAQTMMRPAASFSSSATTMMRAEDLASLGQMETGTMIQGAAETRQVPQWVFLSHIFSHVLLQDKAALGASGASSKVNTWRRVLLASATAVAVIFLLGFFISLLSNRMLEGDVVSAATAVPVAQQSNTQPPATDDLRRLDALRQSLQTLGGYQQSGAPWHLRWGLYSGSDIYPDARAVYFGRFRPMLFGSTQDALRQSLNLLPATPTPTDDYTNAYANLKAYLITTSNPDKSTRDFLTPVLLRNWPAGQNIDDTRRQLAQQQFDFYSDQLRLSNPYSSEADLGAVARARHYLAQFAATQRVYHAMLADASKGNPGLNFARQFPDAAQVVKDGHEVDGPFTKGGYAAMQEAFQHMDRYFSGEEWVLGQQSGAGLDRAGLDQQLSALYTKDYMDQWRGFLNDAAVARYGNVQDAAGKLLKLSGNQSPVLVLLCQVSMNTAVGSADIQKAFQPVQQVVSPGCKDQYIQPGNKDYINALLQLQGCMDQLTNTPKEQQDAAKGMCLTAATQAKTATLQIAQGFKVDSDGHVDRTVQTLMQQPITLAQGALQGQGPAGAESLCGQLQVLASKYPFNPRASQQANLNEVAGFFAPAGGALTKFYQDNLTNVLVPQGGSYAPKPGSTVALNPAFVSFFDQAARIQSAMYPAGSAQADYQYAIRPYASEGIQSLTLTIDGKTYTATGSNPAPLQYVWPGAGGVTLTAKFGGGAELTLLNFQGPFAVFDFFAAASSIRPNGGVYHVEWSPTTSGQPMRLANGHPITLQFDVDTKGQPFIFEKGALAGLRCVTKVAAAR